MAVDKLTRSVEKEENISTARRTPGIVENKQQPSQLGRNMLGFNAPAPFVAQTRSIETNRAHSPAGPTWRSESISTIRTPGVVENKKQSF
jgi:hypothetical protein